MNIKFLSKNARDVMFLINYECITSAGLGVDRLLKSLSAGTVHSQKVSTDDFSQPVVAGGSVCFLPNQNIKTRNFKNTFTENLKNVAHQFFSTLDSALITKLSEKKVLCILSSTKGCIEDSIWSAKNGSSTAVDHADPFSELNTQIKLVFSTYLNHNPLFDTMTVSNACSSSHVALEVGSAALADSHYDYIFIVAFDLVGPFVYSGFQSLKVLSQTENKPFADDRDGLQLGEALAVLLLSNTPTEKYKCVVQSVASCIQPTSVTRPSMDGQCLLSTLNLAAQDANFENTFFIVHGTGTKFNDMAEDKALYEFQQKNKTSAPVSGLKWSIGHCLGASGALDLIAASEVLKSKKLFSIATTVKTDTEFLNSYLIGKNQTLQKNFNSAFVTSLGFGGLHASLYLTAGQI